MGRLLGVGLADSAAAEPDPLEVLRWTGDLGDLDMTRAVDVDNIHASQPEQFYVPSLVRSIGESLCRWEAAGGYLGGSPKDLINSMSASTVRRGGSSVCPFAHVWTHEEA